jgi:hypothetical protein
VYAIQRVRLRAAIDLPYCLEHRAAAVSLVLRIRKPVRFPPVARPFDHSGCRVTDASIDLFENVHGLVAVEQPDSSGRRNLVAKPGFRAIDVNARVEHCRAITKALIDVSF